MMWDCLTGDKRIDLLLRSSKASRKFLVKYFKVLSRSQMINIAGVKVMNKLTK
jgi:hypothetical protein